MRCILQLYSPNCSTTALLPLLLWLTSLCFPCLLLRSPPALLLQFTLPRRRPAISQQFNFLLCQQVESNAMLIKCCQPSPASQLISKANSRCQQQCETSEAERQSKPRRVYATWCAFVLTSLPIYPSHKQSTPHNNGQYIQTCVQPAEGSGECWLPLLFDIYLPFPPNHKDAAASLLATRREPRRPR